MSVARNNSEPGGWDVRSGIGVTALAVAAARAVETARPDPLIRDPYAAAFVRAAGESGRLPVDDAEVAAMPEHDARTFGGFVDYLAVRTRHFDAFFEAAAAAGIDQAVVLDTRAYRLAWAPGTSVYEIDQPAVLAFKGDVLDAGGAEPRRERRPVAADLRDDWAAALVAAGLDPRRPTAWLAEGLLPYLPAAVEERLLATIERLSAPGSRLAVEHLGREVIRTFGDDLALVQQGVRMGADMSAMWNTEPRPDAVDRLRAAGWTVRPEVVGTVVGRYGRRLAARDTRRTEEGHFVTASR